MSPYTTAYAKLRRQGYQLGADRLTALREPLERGEELSHTQWEAWLALYHNKPLLIAAAAADAERAEASRTTRGRLHRRGATGAEGHYPGTKNGFNSVDQLAK